MQESAPGSSNTATLPVILTAAVAQGWALYGLHQAISHQVWPATDPAWLLALYAVAVLVPVTIQLSAEYARSAAHWLLVSLNGDGVDEFLLLTANGGLAYQSRADKWQLVGHVHPLRRPVANWPAFLGDLAKGDLAPQEPAWKELRVGTQRFELDSRE
jgi:hypothetical protein